MSITTYAELKTAVGRWVGASDDATATSLGITSTIDDLVTIAEKRILREVRSKDTETAISSVISSGVIAVPSDYVAIKYLYLNTTPAQFLEPRSPVWIYENYPYRSSEDQPKFFARETTNFIFGPYPDSTYTVKGVYYKTPATALSAGVYDLFTNNPDLYLFGCLAEAEILIGKDARIPLWEAKYKKILSDVNGLNMSAELGSGSLRMRIA